MGDWDWQRLETLSEQERRVLGVRFGYAHTLAETAALLVSQDGTRGLSRPRVRQIEQEALRKLRDAGYTVCRVPRAPYRFVLGRPDDAVECDGDDASL